MRTRLRGSRWSLPDGLRRALVFTLSVGVLIAPAVAVGQPEMVWEPAEEIASTSTATFGEATSISCVTDDDCVMVGYLGWPPAAAVAAEKVGGQWSELRENPGLSELDLPDWNPDLAEFNRVSCLSSGECVAGGKLGLKTGGSTGFVSTRVGGTWSAETIPGLVELSTTTGATAEASVIDLSCDATGTCLAGGQYTYGSANNLSGGWVATRSSGGVWSQAVAVPGLQSLNTKDNARVNSVVCAGGGNCIVTGTYSTLVGANTRGQAFIAEYANGTWTDAFPAPGLLPPEGVNQGTASFEGLACVDFDNCAATGRYWNGSGFQVFVVHKTAGTWADPLPVPGLGPAANRQAQHITCPAVGACALMAGDYVANTGYFASQSDGVWQDAVPLTFAIPGSTFNALRGISCSAPGECIATGIYRASDFSTFQAWQAVQSAGSWAEANTIPGMDDLLTDPPSRSHGQVVSCVSGAGCNVGGVTFFGGVPHRLFAAARVSAGPTATAPAAPTALSATAGDRSVTVTFTPGDDGGASITNYEYRIGGGTWTAFAPAVTASPVTITGLTNGTPSTIALRAVNDVGPGEASSTVTATPRTVPGMVTGTTATAGDGRVTLTWTAPASDGGAAVTGYTVTSTPSSAGCTTATADGTAPATTCTITGLTNGTEHTFSVTAQNVAGSSPAATVRATPAAAAAPQPAPQPAPGPAPQPAPQPGPAPTSWIPTPEGTAPLVAPAAGVIQREGGQAESLVTSSTRPGELAYTDSGGTTTVTFTGDAATTIARGLVARSDGMVECVICAQIAAGETVEIWAFSTPRLVASAIADGSGCITVMVPLANPLDGGPAIEPGQHTLQAIIPTAEGRVAVNVGVTVGSLAPTTVPAGGGSDGPGAAALILLATILVALQLLVRSGRRRGMLAG